MASDTRHVKGLAACHNALKQFPVKMERNVMRGALRAGMNTVKPVAQGMIHNVSGDLSRGLKVGTRARGRRIIARLRATGRHRFIAHLVEFGTGAHTIIARIRRALSFGGVAVRKIEHPGSRAKPFMRPALDTQATSAMIAVGRYIKARLTKQGLDTAHIKIEGDE